MDEKLKIKDEKLRTHSSSMQPSKNSKANKLQLPCMLLSRNAWSPNLPILNHSLVQDVFFFLCFFHNLETFQAQHLKKINMH
jgi:hypothetical protein